MLALELVIKIYEAFFLDAVKIIDALTIHSIQSSIYRTKKDYSCISNISTRLV